MTRAALSLGLLALAGPGCEACGPEARTSAGAGTGGVLETTSNGSTPGVVDTSGGSGTPDPTGLGGTTSSTAPTSSSTTGGASTGFFPSVPDLPPFPEACWTPSPTVVVERAEGPEGTLSFDQVYIVTDFCSHGPVLHLEDTSAGARLLCVLDDPQPLQGLLDCSYFSGGPSEFTAELLEPYEDPDWDTATSGVHLHARIVAAGNGWDVSVVVDVPECGDLDCFCPCE